MPRALSPGAASARVLASAPCVVAQLFRLLRLVHPYFATMRPGTYAAMRRRAGEATRSVCECCGSEYARRAGSMRASPDGGEQEVRGGRCLGGGAKRVRCPSAARSRGGGSMSSVRQRRARARQRRRLLRLRCSKVAGELGWCARLYRCYATKSGRLAGAGTSFCADSAIAETVCRQQRAIRQRHSPVPGGRTGVFSSREMLSAYLRCACLLLR